MAEEISAHDSARLAVALSTWREWSRGPARQPEVLARIGGLSNSSFLVGIEAAEILAGTEGAGTTKRSNNCQQRWVVRLNNPTQDRGINRNNEYSAQRAAAVLGFAPHISFATDEMLITPFVAGAAPTREHLPAIGTLLRRVHEMSVDLTPLDPLRHLNDCIVDDDSTEVAECADRLRAQFPPTCVVPKPCHNDSLFPNLIGTGTGLILIDWEYAAASDPAFELAVLSASYSLDAREKASLLAGYGDGRVCAALAKRVSYYEDYYRLLEILWWRRRGEPRSAQLSALTLRLRTTPVIL